MSCCKKMIMIVMTFISCSFALHTTAKMSMRHTMHRVLLSQSLLKMKADSNSDDIFGAEFRIEDAKTSSTSSSATIGTTNSVASNSLTPTKKGNIPTKPRNEIMKGFEKMRVSYVSDSLVVAIAGFSITWMLGTLHDSVSYGIGSLLGIMYSILLGKYVERIGTSRENKASDGLRFIPVVFLVLLYAKFKTIFSIIPELIGFIVSSQVSSFLQILNDNLYGELESN